MTRGSIVLSVVILLAGCAQEPMQYIPPADRAGVVPFSVETPLTAIAR